MAQVTLLGPDNDFEGPATREQTAERGWSWKRVLDAINAMMTELYATANAAAPAINTVGVGAAAGTGVVAAESGNGAFHKTVLTLTNTPLVLVDNAGVVAHTGLKIYDMPEGAILFCGATANLALTKSSAGVNADWDGDFALGTAVATTDADLADAGEGNLIPSTPTPQAVAGATTATGQSTNTEAAKVIDGHTTAMDVYLNALVDDADQDVTGTPCNLIANGTITLLWANLGDYT